MLPSRRAMLLTTANVFDFTGASLPAGSTLARASNGVRIKPTGSPELLGTDAARFDYRNGVLKGLLVEKAQTYLSDWSDGTNAQWSIKSGVSASASPIDPFFVNSQYFIDNAALRYAYQSITVTAADHAYVLFVKMRDGSAPNVGTSESDPTVDMIPVFTNNVTTSTITVEALGGGLYMISFIQTNAVAAERNFGIVKFNTNSPKGFDITGLNICQSSKVPSYFPVAGGAATRAADILTLQIPSGWHTARVVFDDASVQDFAVTGGSNWVVDASLLNRRWVKRIERAA